MSSLQEQFDTAAEKARNINVNNNATKQQIYGLYKQATEGPMGDDRPRPGMFDPTGRAKYDGWKALGDMSKEDAMKRYIALIDSLPQ